MAIDRIDHEKCVGCGACVNSCAMDVIRLGDVLAHQALMTPCRSACPAGVDIRGYISLLNQGKVKEAIETIRESLPLPAVTGHVCFHPCESECARRYVDEAVNINSLERYIAEYWLQEKAKPALTRYSEKVAVIGSGPAGLAGAYDLVRMGYPVTVFESRPAPGGMLRYGIPDYRLPPKILDAQIAYIRDLGVNFKTGVSFGRDLTIHELRKSGYEAVLIAVGAQLGRRLEIEGVQLKNVLWGLDVLRDVKLRRKVYAQERVAIVGGGNVAVDVALTVRRLGAREVQVFCLERREEMPAHDEAIDIALEEGVIINGSWGPQRIVGKSGHVTGIQLVRCLSVYDENGAFKPRFEVGESRLVETDMVIFAVGESPDLTILPRSIETDKNHIIVDPATLATNLPGIFSAGAAVSGPGIVVEAIASGKKAALSIDRYLRGEELNSGREAEINTVKKPPCEGVEKRPRQMTRLVPAGKRAKSFEEIKLGFDRQSAEQEARRCMACGSKASIQYLEDCMTCYSCERDCPETAIYVSPEHLKARMSSWG